MGSDRGRRRTVHGEGEDSPGRVQQDYAKAGELHLRRAAQIWQLLVKFEKTKQMEVSIFNGENKIEFGAVMSGADVRKSCRSRNMLPNEYLSTSIYLLNRLLLQPRMSIHNVLIPTIRHTTTTCKVHCTSFAGRFIEQSTAALGESWQNSVSR